MNFNKILGHGCLYRASVFRLIQKQCDKWICTMVSELWSCWSKYLIFSLAFKDTVGLLYHIITRYPPTEASSKMSPKCSLIAPWLVNIISKVTIILMDKHEVPFGQITQCYSGVTQSLMEMFVSSISWWCNTNKIFFNSICTSVKGHEALMQKACSCNL